MWSDFNVTQRVEFECYFLSTCLIFEMSGNLGNLVKDNMLS